MKLPWNGPIRSFKNGRNLVTDFSDDLVGHITKTN